MLAPAEAGASLPPGSTDLHALTCTDIFSSIAEDDHATPLTRPYAGPVRP